MSKPLTIVAIFQARPGRERDLAAELETLIEPTRAETGCLNYDLHGDLEINGRFLFYENWATREDWDAHMNSEHLQRHKANSGPLVEKLQILQMEPTG